MISSRKILMLGCLILLCLTQSGCELLQLPAQLIGGVFGLAGQVLNVASSLPTPPPWMFF